MAFNGTGYADMDNAKDYLESYIAYKTMRKDVKAIRLAQIYHMEVLPTIENLLRNSAGAGRQPNDKNLTKFQSFRKHTQIDLF